MHVIPNVALASSNVCPGYRRSSRMSILQFLTRKRSHSVASLQIISQASPPLRPTTPLPLDREPQDLRSRIHELEDIVEDVVAS